MALDQVEDHKWSKTFGSHNGEQSLLPDGGGGLSFFMTNWMKVVDLGETSCGALKSTGVGRRIGGLGICFDACANAGVERGRWCPFAHGHAAPSRRAAEPMA